MTVRRMGGWVGEWMERKKRSIASEWEGQGIKGRKEGWEEGSPLAHVEITPLRRVLHILAHYRPEKSCLGMWLLWMALLGCCWCWWGAFVWIARIAWMDGWNLLMPNRAPPWLGMSSERAREGKAGGYDLSRDHH